MAADGVGHAEHELCDALGQARIVEAVRTYKLLVLGSFFRDWTMQEIQTFLPLLARFSEWSERAEQPGGPVESEIAELRGSLAGIVGDAG